MKSPWLSYLLIALVIEKIIQHLLVTLALYFDWATIDATVVIHPRILMVLGAMVTILFALALWGLFQERGWAVDLVTGLAIFDILGEFAAQGRLDIVINVSFLVAVALLILAILYRRQKRRLAS